MSLADHYLRWTPDGEGDGEWVCNCGQTFGHSISNGFKHQKESMSERL